MDNMGDGFNRRQVLGALGAGVTGSLAGCNQALEPKDDQTNDPNSNGSQDKPQEIGITDAPNPNLSNVDLNRHEGDTYGLSFTRDTADLEGDVTVQVTNGVQEQVYETTADEIAKLDNRAAINLPETLFTHGDSILSVEFHDEDIEGPLQAEINTQTPQAFPIDRSIEGEQASSFQTEWGFAQQDLDTEEAIQAHHNYLNNKIVREPIADGSLYDGTHGLGSDYDDRIAQIEQMDPSTEMLDILEIAGDIASDMEHDVPNTPTTGTTQSGEEIGHGAAQIIRDIHDTDLKTIVASSPENSLDEIIHYNPESDELIWQGTSGTSRPMEEQFKVIEGDKINPAMIYGFEPGEIEGIDYERKSENAINSLNSAVTTTPALSSTKPINDYAIEIISQEHLFGDGDTQEAFDTLASLNRVEEMVNHDINGEPLYEVGESLQNAMYVGLAADPGDNLEDMTMFVTDNGAVYDNITTDSEPTSKSELEQIAGLN
ncbi:MAG: hypothetical protein R6V35_04325 [Candidatus Nanohaloarchaea archaeon]